MTQIQNRKIKQTTDDPSEGSRLPSFSFHLSSLKLFLLPSGSLFPYPLLVLPSNLHYIVVNFHLCLICTIRSRAQLVNLSHLGLGCTKLTIPLTRHELVHLKYIEIIAESGTEGPSLYPQSCQPKGKANPRKSIMQGGVAEGSWRRTASLRKVRRMVILAWTSGETIDCQRNSRKEARKTWSGATLTERHFLSGDETNKI